MPEGIKRIGIRIEPAATGEGPSAAEAFASPTPAIQGFDVASQSQASHIARKTRPVVLRHASSYLLPDQTIPCTTCEKPLHSTCPNSRWTASQPPTLMTQAKVASFA